VRKIRSAFVKIGFRFPSTSCNTLASVWLAWLSSQGRTFAGYVSC